MSFNPNDWGNKLKLTINSSKIDESLEYFPMLIALSSDSGQTGFDATGVFDELSTASGSYDNRKKIAVTTTISGVEIKLFTEIERWDDTTASGNKQAWLWARVPAVVSGTNTDLYLYYDKNQDDQDERTLAEANDTFTGTNGDLPNQELWRNHLGMPTIQSNQLRLQTTAVPVVDSVHSRYNITGDFDIQVDYDVTGHPSGVRSWQLMLRIFIDGANYIYIGRKGSDTSQDYLKKEVISGTPTYTHSAATTDNSGKLRITRTGSTWHVYYYNSGWVEVGTGSVVGSGTVTVVELIANTWDTNPAYIGYFDNFIINSAGSITGFVDDTLGKPAQEVWDDNFVGVWHMNEDPSKGSDANTNHLDEDMVDITDWSDGNSVNGLCSQVTFDSKSCMKLDAKTAADGNWARRYRDVGTFGNRVVVEFSIYFDALGTLANTDMMELGILNDLVRCDIAFASDGLYIHNGSAFQLIGTNPIVQDVWQKWTFDINFTTPASATVDIYLNDVLHAADVDCSRTGSWTDGLVSLLQRGCTTNDRISYVDYIKVGDGVVNNVKDSTYNANHGTSAGAMTSADLVDGKIGKAIDFDGINDCIDINHTFASESLTVECIVNATELPVVGDYSTPVGMQDHVYLSWDHVNTDYKGTFTAAYGGAWPKVSLGISSVTGYLYLAGIGTASRLAAYRDGELINEDSSPGTPTINTNDLFLGKVATLPNYWPGIVCEVRISDIDRGTAWIKATYYSNWDNLITFDAGADLSYYFSGYVYEQGSPAQRTLYLHHRPDGELVDTTTSSGNGYYYLETTYSGSHYVVCLDDSAGEDYNDLIIGDIYPTTISG